MAGKYGYVGNPVTHKGKKVLSAGQVGTGAGDAQEASPGYAGELANENGFLESLGLLPLVIDPNAPGARLDTTYADAQRQKMQALIASLQQQAATGDGSWQDDFAQAVQRSKAAASALGQSQPGTSVQSSLMGIGNAQAAAGQRAVGEEQQLRAQSQLDARNQLGGVLGQQGQGDIAQAEEEARVLRGRRTAQQALNEQSSEARQNLRSSILEAVPMSDGGKVPGKAPVFGDDEQNDTVRAMLSPGEIVIPRSIVSAANAPEQAAEFVRAVQRRQGGGAQHLAGGGEARNGDGLTSLGELPGDITAASIFTPAIGLAMADDWVSRHTGTGYQPLSTTTGSLLNDEPYRQTAGQQDELASLFSGQAAGNGPSMAPAMAQRAQDDALASALQARAGGRVPAGDLLQMTVAQGVGDAAAAGRQAGMEQSRGQSAFANAVAQRRAHEYALARGQQGAAWENTLANAGLKLDSQAKLRNAFAGAGQAAAGIASMGSGRGVDTDRVEADETGERGGYTDLSTTDPDFKWRGGAVHAFQGAVMPPSMYEAALFRMPDGSVAPQSAMPQQAPSMAGSLPVSTLPPSLKGRLAELQGPGMGQQLAGGAVDVAKGVARQLPVVGDAMRANDALGSALKGGAEQRAAMPAGVTPKKAADAPPATETPPAATPQPAGVTPRMGGAGAPSLPRVDAAGQAEADRLALGAAQQRADVEKQQARVEQEGLIERQHAIEADALRRKEIDERGRKETGEAMTRYRAAQESLSRIDTNVDPGRFWASRTTDQKVMGILGLVLGSLGTRDGTNKAAVMLNQAVDRDIDAQKTQVEAAMRKGGRAIEAAQSFYGMARQAVGDELASADLAKASALEAVSNKTAQLMAATKDPMAQAKLQEFQAALKKSQADLYAAGEQRIFEDKLKRGHLINESMEVGAKLNGAGAPPVDKEALHTAQAVREKANTIRNNLARAEEIIKRSGTFELTGADQSELGNMLSSIATDMSKLKDPASAARPGEVEQEVKNIGFAAGTLTTRNTTALEMLKRYRNSVDARESEGLRVRGFAK